MAILNWLAKLFLEFVWAKLVAWLDGLIARVKRQKEIKDEAEESVKPLKDAKTADEIDKASDKALDGF